jgi:hypothetical protein
VLAVTVKHKGLNQHRKNGACNIVLPAQSLPKEITRMQSSRAQQLACIAWPSRRCIE